MVSLYLSTQSYAVFHRGMLFLLYTADTVSFAQRHHVAIHSYADDTQVYASCSATDGTTLAAQLLCCITDIADWMTSNQLKVNTEKTQFICLSSSYCTALVNHLSLTHDALHTLIHAFIASHIDYCNTLLYSVTDGII